MPQSTTPELLVAGYGVLPVMFTVTVETYVPTSVPPGIASVPPTGSENWPSPSPAGADQMVAEVVLGVIAGLV